MSNKPSFGPPGGGGGLVGIAETEDTSDERAREVTTTEPPGYTMVWLEITASSAMWGRKDGWRDSERDRKSDRSGMFSMSGRNVVECDSDMAKPVLVLAIDRIVRIEPVDDCVSEQSGTATERSRTLLNIS
jgi:hypothetical protein